MGSANYSKWTILIGWDVMQGLKVYHACPSNLVLKRPFTITVNGVEIYILWVEMWVPYLQKLWFNHNIVFTFLPNLDNGHWPRFTSQQQNIFQTWIVIKRYVD